MKNFKKTAFLVIVLTLLLAFTGCGNQGKDQEDKGGKDSQGQYPAKEISLIIPFGAGGGTDTIARVVASELEKELGATIVVLNKDSAGGIVGSNEIAAAKPDGYTLGVFSNTDVANFVYSVKESVNFDTESFTYIGGLNETGNLLITPKDSDIKSLDDLKDKALENPGSLTIAIPSKTQALDIELMENAMEMEVTEVVYEGGSKVLADLMGGHIDAGILGASFVSQAEEAGLNILGLMLEKRLETIPDIPTFAEQGYEVNNAAARMLVAPKDLPEDILNVLESALAKAYEGELSQKLLEMGEAPVYRNSSQLVDFLKYDFSMREVILNK